MVQLERMPSRWTSRAISSQRRPSVLWSQISRRTRSAKISAPPPGHESSPADRRRSMSSSRLTEDSVSMIVSPGSRITSDPPGEILTNLPPRRSILVGSGSSWTRNMQGPPDPSSLAATASLAAPTPEPIMTTTCSASAAPAPSRWTCESWRPATGTCDRRPPGERFGRTSSFGWTWCLSTCLPFGRGSRTSRSSLKARWIGFSGEAAYPHPSSPPGP